MTGTGEMDATWLLTHGAHMSWRYARSVQPALVDLDAALEVGNWALALESARAALRAIAFTSWVGRGLSGSPQTAEIHLRLALDDSPAAKSLRALPWSMAATEADARAAARVVAEHDAALRATLPFDMPEIRTELGQGPAMRITATVSRWREERGLGPVNWNREGV